MKKKILIIGAGGHSKSCIDILKQCNKYEIYGIIGLNSEVGKKVSDIPVIGVDKDLLELRNIVDHAFIAIGQIKSPEKRIKIYKHLKKLNFILPAFYSNNSYVSPFAEIMEGTIVMHHCVINAGVKIGKCVIINNMSLIEHDSSVGNFTHVSTNVVLNGNVIVGDRSFIGSKTVTSNNIVIDNDEFIKMGSILKKWKKKRKLYL